MNRLVLLLWLIVLAVAPRLVRAQGSITGSVRDAVSAAPLADVTVAVIGTQLTGATGADGQFSIGGVPPGSRRLRARRLGYAAGDTTVVVQDGERTVVDLRLQASAVELEAVVAVGYGTQSKATLTGAVSAVSGQDLQSVPAANLSNAMTGKLPGVITINTSGEPGADGAIIRVRGNHTLNDNSPLVVIDGVPDRMGGLDRLDPTDIESMSVLKDASAAIYGSRAANGVILITTKRGSGSGKPQVTASFNQGFNHPTRLPKMADAATYMTMLNEIDSYRNRTPRYTSEQIQNYRQGGDPWLYPNTDWFGAVVKPMSLQNNGHVAVRGGAERIGYYLSLNRLTEDGYYRNSGTRYNQYSFRSNIDGRLSDRLKVRFDVSGRIEDRSYPARSAGSIFRSLMRGKPNLPAYWPNGLPGPDIEYGDNPAVISTRATGYDRDGRDYLQGNLGLDLEVPRIHGLTLRANAAYDYRLRNVKSWRTPWTLYTWDYKTRDANGQPVLQAASRGYSQPELNDYDHRSANIMLNLVAEYRRDFGPHTIGILGGIERQTADSSAVNAYRKGFVSDQIDELFAGGNLGKNNGGTAWIAARQNYFTRVNYDFQDKYLFEFVARYDGSYIFPQAKRFGFFPGVSAGWRVSEEPFFRNKVPLFDELKLRASWGRTGNDRIDEWQYLGTYGFGSGYVLGVNNEVTSLYQTRTPNPDVSWEVASQLDLGLEGTLLNNRLSFVLDRFSERRSSILWWRNRSVPQTAGVPLPRENIGKVSSWGYDGSVAWHEQLSPDVSYDVSFNAAYAQNRVDFWDEPPGAPAWQRSTGYRMRSSLYYRAIGVFKDQAAVDAYAHWAGARPGDIIFEDVNHDGQITADDRVRINADSIPVITGGLRLGVQVKSFDFSALFQTALGAVQYFRTESGDIGNYTQDFAQNRWTPDHPNDTHPRAFNRQDEYWAANPNAANQNADGANTYFLRDASYIRLKSLELGYRLPVLVAQHLGLRDVRLYANGFNLLLLDKFGVLDPETRNSQGQYYPQQRVFNVGATVTF
jgi:TonB-linked SusC/RagA family outer membrane protein